jgi:hypothetical protein
MRTSLLRLAVGVSLAVGAWMLFVHASELDRRWRERDARLIRGIGYVTATDQLRNSRGQLTGQWSVTYTYGPHEEEAGATFYAWPGRTIDVFYDPANPRYVQLSPPGTGGPPPYRGGAILLAGIGLLVAAAAARRFVRPRARAAAAATPTVPRARIITRRATSGLDG